MAATRQPSGTVTLVFTDIEGSTRLLESLGTEAYRSALRDHQRAVRDAFDRHDGYEVDTAGDGFFYAFPTATGAAQAVGDALAALEGGRIRVRVGMHTGEPTVEGAKYVGLDVHRAARIMSAAHGGQALLSRTTRDLLEDGFAVRDLGEHRLKDLSAPQRLFQLGTAEFPRPRTLHLTNLPVPATDFLGRDPEVVAVVEALQSVRLLTLTGPGGTGKTRLALQAAAEAADDFPDGVWWVPLAALQDPGLVLRHAARTLDVVEQPDRPLAEAMAEMLGGKRMLLVVDNAEHLLPGAADAIAVLRDLDGPRLLVTSRERLQIGGEHVYPVPQLTPVEGIDLFATRAVAIDPRFQSDAAVADLCARLDNLPLAIELAAARITVLQPEQILERLGSRLDLLKGARDADPRQQTLRATIEWSYDLLTPAERKLASRFSVFAGGARLEAVEEVCRADVDTLGSLVDKSILRRDADRFWMLETIREYGSEQLANPDRDEVIENHGAYFERFAAEARDGLRGPDAAGWLDRVEQELPNLRGAMGRLLERGSTGRALGIASGLGRYWETRSSSTEGRRWLERTLTEGPVDDVVRAAGCFWAGHLALFQGDLTAAAESFADAAQAAQTAEEVYLEAVSLGYLGWVAHERGFLADVPAPVERSRALLAQLTDPWERSEVLLALYLEDRDETAEEVLALKREAGDVIATSDSLNNLAWEDLRAGELDRAIAKLQEALAIAHELGDTFRITLAAGNLGLAAVLQERHEQAVPRLRDTLLLCIRRGDRRCGSEAILGLAVATAGLGEDELSVRLDTISRALMAEAGIVYQAWMLERLDPTLALARTRLGPERVEQLEAGSDPPSLELALELLDRAREAGR